MLLLSCASLLLCTPNGRAQTVAPNYAGTYTATSLGSVPGVPTRYGGLTFKAGDPNTLLIGGSANTSSATIQAITVVRDANKHIIGFTGTATQFATAPGRSWGGIDGGLTYGPGNVLFYTSYSDNSIGQIKPGSTAPNKLIDLNASAVGSSVGSLMFVPPGQPGAGRLKILSYSVDRWYDAPYSADGSGTFNIGAATVDILIGGGPEGVIYVPSDSPLFPAPAILVSEYRNGIVAAYDVNTNGDPITSTRREFVTGLSGAEGAAIDPLTGDFLFSTFGGSNQVVVVKGFNQPPPNLTINNVTVTEGNTGTTVATFTLTLSNASTKTITVNYATANGTAIAGSDYTAGNGSVTFTPGQTTRTVTVPVTGDVLDEANETFFVNLTSPVNAIITDNQGQGTITDDDAAPSLTIGDVTVTEGNTGTTNAVFTVRLSGASGQAVRVNYATANGTTNPATAGSDYTTATGTLTINPGATTGTITVPVTGDTSVELNETFFVNLTVPVNATVADAQAIGTITNDDTAVTLSINNVTVTEGDTGSVNAVFTVTLSAASAAQVTVNYATANSIATAGSDYTAANGTLTFTPGQTSKTVTVAVLGDLLDEANELFFVNLSSPTNATLADGQGVGTITDNDAAPTLRINDVTVTEGNTATINAVFTVSLSRASGQAVRVNYATANGATNPATAASDYTTTTGTLTINSGATTGSITVPVKGETIPEFNETFVVNLTTPVNATLADSQGVGTIINDDGPVPSVFIGDVIIREGDQGTGSLYFTVRLSSPATNPVSVRYATANGTTNPATAGSDYTAATGTLTFAAGQISLPVAIAVIGDTVAESNEQFLVSLSAPIGVTIIDAQGIGTLTNDDVATTAGLTRQVLNAAEPVEETALPVSADASASTIAVQFLTALNEDAANNLANYSVEVNNVVVPVPDIKIDAASGSVLLLLPEGSLQVNDEIKFSWRISSVSGAQLTGSTLITAR
jgi:hypothetical protein